MRQICQALHLMEPATSFDVRQLSNRESRRKLIVALEKVAQAAPQDQEVLGYFRKHYKGVDLRRQHY